MSRASLSLVISLVLLSLCHARVTAATPNAGLSSAKAQVVYIVDGVTITTYNIDPETLNANPVGTPLTVNGAAAFYSLFPSPNDHFLYVVADHANSVRHLWVFPTDSNGVPQSKPIEEIEVNHLYQVTIDPEANFAYLVFGYPTNNYKTDYFIRRYQVNSATGTITAPIDEAKYIVPNLDADTCFVWVTGFNPSGTSLYDEVACGTHEGFGATYYERTVNPSTGALGPDIQVYGYFNGSGGGEQVQFIGEHMFDFVEPNNYQQGYNSANIYPIVPNTSKPVLQCTAQMLEACGYATGRAHPSGEYVFMNISQDSTQIDKVELSAKKIVDTGNYIPYQVWAFSPDGTLVYGILNVNTGYYIEIYGFDVSTSEVIPGGSIWVPSGLESYFIAERE